MKKLLLILGATTLTATAVSSVVACGGNKPEKKVILLLPQETIGTTSLDKQTAYKDLVNEFNRANAEKIKAGEMVEIEVKWEKSGNIAKNIAARGNLPDLYVFYPDAVSTFAYSGAGENVRDMKKSYGTEGEFTKFKESLITDSYIKEGEYEKTKGNKTQLVLPFGKSVDLSVINVRTLVDLLETLGIDSDKKIRESFNNYNKETRINMLGKYPELSTYSSLDKDKAIKAYDEISDIQKTKFEELMKPLLDADSTSIASEIRNLFKSNEDVLLITEVISEIYQTSIKYSGVSGQDKDATIQEALNTTANKSHYAFSIDSIENKFFIDHGAVSGNENIDIADSNNGFMYNSQLNYDVNKGRVKSTDVEFNPSSEGYKHTIELLDGFKKIASKHKKTASGNSANLEKDWNGTFMTKYSGTTGSVYTSTLFLNGTTLVGSSSSAGAYNYLGGPRYNDANGNSKKIYLTQNPDILTTSSIGNEKDAFMSQGPGLAGFKSNGENAAEKETTVTAFLQYIMQPVQTVQFALKTNYMPSTRNAMEIYKNYIDGTYNNTEAFNFAQDKTKALASAKDENEKLKIQNAHYLFNELENKDGSWEITDVKEKNKSRINSLNEVYDKLNSSSTFDETTDKKEWRFEEIFTPLSDYSSDTKANTRAVSSAVNAGYVNDFLMPLLEQENGTKAESNTLLVTSTPSPIGDTFRNGIKTAVVEGKQGTIMYNWDVNFEDLLKDDATKAFALKRYIIAKNGDDVLKKVNVTIKK